MRGTNWKSSRPTALLVLALGATALLALSGIAMAKDRRGDVGHGRHAHRQHLRELHDAGTITSFDAASGELTLELTGGGSVTGLVTTRTVIECEGVDDRLAQRRDRGDEDDGPAGGSGQEDGAHPQPGDDNGGDAPMPSSDSPTPGAPASCGAGSLVPGAFVGEAELRVGTGSAAFRKIELGQHS